MSKINTQASWFFAKYALIAVFYHDAIFVNNIPAFLFSSNAASRVWRAWTQIVFQANSHLEAAAHGHTATSTKKRFKKRQRSKDQNF